MSSFPVTATKVTVTFPLARGKPFAATEPSDATVGVIRTAAMAQFGVHEDPGSRYYLTHGPHDEKLADGTLIGSIAEENAVKLTLVKELIQG
jgi:hypothetical protein